MRLSLVVAALVAGTLLPSLAEAQKRCVKGIPCGNTCIAANKTCRVGSPSAAPTPAPRREAPPAEPMPPRRVLAAPVPTATPTSSGPINLAADTTGFVAIAGGTVYYRAACQAARELPERYVVRLSSEEAAQRVGMTRSKVPDC